LDLLLHDELCSGLGLDWPWMEAWRPGQAMRASQRHRPSTTTSSTHQNSTCRSALWVLLYKNPPPTAVLQPQVAQPPPCFSSFLRHYTLLLYFLYPSLHTGKDAPKPAAAPGSSPACVLGPGPTVRFGVGWVAVGCFAICSCSNSLPLHSFITSSMMTSLPSLAPFLAFFFSGTWRTRGKASDPWTTHPGTARRTESLPRTRRASNTSAGTGRIRLCVLVDLSSSSPPLHPPPLSFHNPCTSDCLKAHTAMPTSPTASSLPPSLTHSLPPSTSHTTGEPPSNTPASGNALYGPGTIPSITTHLGGRGVWGVGW